MSRTFVNLDNGKLTCTLGAGVTYPLTLFLWVKKTDWSTAADSFISLAQDGASNNNRLFLDNLAGTADAARCAAVDGVGTAGDSVAFTANTADGIWVAVMGVFTSATNRQAFGFYPKISGAGSSTERLLTDLDEIVIGENPSGTNGTDGSLAEIAIWNKALTGTDFDTLVTSAENGTSPAALYYSDLIDHWSFLTSSLVGTKGNTLTLTNTADWSGDHPIITSAGTTITPNTAGLSV